VTVLWTDKGGGRNLLPPLEHPVLDPTGSCLLTGLPPSLGVHMLHVDVPDGAAAPDQLRLESAEQIGQLHRIVELQVVAQDQQQVRGRLLHQGQPLPDQQLVCSGGWTTASTLATTDREGRFVLASRLPSGTPYSLQLASTTLVLDAEGDHRFRGEFEGKVEPERDLDLRAIPVARVTGRIVDTDGHGVANVEVQLRRGKSYYGSRSTSTDAAGRFAFERLNGRDTEAFRVHVEEEAGFADSDPFQLLDGGTRGIAPLTLQPPASIGGVVHGPDGKPLGGARVVLRRCEAGTGHQSDGSRIETVADREGRFRFVGLEPRPWRLHHYELGSRDKVTIGPWFELRPGASETTVLGPLK
jgi:hypothetical protein